MSVECSSPLTGPGYTKPSDRESESHNMRVEVQFHVTDDINKYCDPNVSIRVGVAFKPGDRAFDDLVENAIRLTLDQARSLAAWILAEVAKAENVIGGDSSKK
jgi:hypothetical protein